MAGRPNSPQLPRRPDDGLPPLQRYHERRRPTPMTMKMRFEAMRGSGINYLQVKPMTLQRAVAEGAFAAIVGVGLCCAVAMAALKITGTTTDTVLYLMGLSPMVGVSWVAFMGVALALGGAGEMIRSNPWHGAIAIAVAGPVLMALGLNPTMFSATVAGGANTAMATLSRCNFPHYWPLVSFCLALGYVGSRTKHRWALAVAAVVAAFAAFDIGQMRDSFANGRVEGFEEARNVFGMVPNIHKALVIRKLGDLALVLAPPLTLFKTLR